MNHVIETVEDLYYATEPIGELIIDSVVECIKKTNTHYPADIAILLDVKDRDLRGAFMMLTGIKLSDVIISWRILQAKDRLKQPELSFKEIAHACGWRSEKSMNNAFVRECGKSIYEIKKESQNAKAHSLK